MTDVVESVDESSTDNTETLLAPQTPVDTIDSITSNNTDDTSDDITSSKLLYIGFNQDYGCFACGTDKGFRIYNCEPFKETFRRDFSDGGIGYVEMLFRCNILALVGGGTNPRYPLNKVMIWDDHQNRCIGELSFRSDVKAVKLRRDRIIVVLQQKIYVYNFADLKLIDHIETMANPSGLCALCSFPANNVLICPGLQRGHVRVELYDMKKPTTLISAHEASLAAFALNSDGSMLATTSVKGTLLRVWDTSTGAALHEFRRGADRALIHSVAFDQSSNWIAVSSDKGTVHVFKLTSDQSRISAPESPNSPITTAAVEGHKPSSLSFVRGFLPKYFSSEWSHAKLRLPESRAIVGFGAEPHSIIVVTTEGSFYKATFDPEVAGDCKKSSFSKFVQCVDEL